MIALRWVAITIGASCVVAIVLVSVLLEHKLWTALLLSGVAIIALIFIVIPSPSKCSAQVSTDNPIRICLICLRSVDLTDAFSGGQFHPECILMFNELYRRTSVESIRE